MASIYKRLNWGDRELLASDKLNDMVGNDDWLYNNMITGFYDNGIQRDTGLSIRTGYAKIANTQDLYVISRVNYARPFLPGSLPVIVDGWACDGNFGNMKAVRSIDGSAIPDHRGFVYMIYDALHALGGNTSNFSGSQYFGYIAIAPNG